MIPDMQENPDAPSFPELLQHGFTSLYERPAQQIETAIQAPLGSQEQITSGLGGTLDILGMLLPAFKGRKGAVAGSYPSRFKGSGKFRGAYEIDKQLGDMLESVGASRESAAYRSTIHLRNMLGELNKEEINDLGDYLVSRRLKAVRGAAVAEDPAAAQTPVHGQILPESEMRRIEANHKIKKALNYYAKEVKPEIESYRSKAGLTGEAIAANPDPLFISLMKADDARKIPGKYGGVQQASRLARKTRFARQATGTAKEYHTDINDLVTESYADVMKKARVNDFYQMARAKGHAEPVRIYTKEGPRSVINFDSLTPELQQQLRAATEVPTQWSGKLPAIGRAIQRGTTGAALTANPAEVTNHMRRQLEILSTVPPIGQGLAARLSLLVPYLGPRTETFARVVFRDADSPVFRKTLQDIIDAGGGSSRSFGNRYELRGRLATYSGLRWLQKKTHNLLFGIPRGKGFNGWDLRMRVALEDIRRTVEGNADPQRVREFANQIGQYGAHPDWFIRGLKTINPYAATSLPMRWTEMKQMVGISGLKEGLMKRRFRQFETMLRGSGGTLLALATANYFLSGKWSWENDPGHEFDLNTGTQNEKGETVYVGFRIISPTLARAVRTTGAIELAREYRTEGVEEPQPGMALATAYANTGLSIISGPAQNAAFTALTGKVPYLVRPPGKKGTDFMDVVGSKDIKGGALLNVIDYLTGSEHTISDRFTRQLVASISNINPLGDFMSPQKESDEVGGVMGLIERPVGGTHLVKPFGNVFTHSYEKPPPKHRQTPAQRAATIRRKMKHKAESQ
jgi:hypothetical protein